MKNVTYANRGLEFEDILKYSINYYEFLGEAIICKIPTAFLPIRGNNGKIINVKVEHKSTVDFIGHYMRIPIAFEAKSTKANRIQFTAVQPHQAEFMDKWQSTGGTSFVIVAFNNLQDFYRIPWTFWKLNMENDKMSRGKKINVKIMDDNGNMVTWTTSGKASFSPGELPDFWRIDSSNIYRLPFLGGHLVRNTEITQM